ncbi:unnamed protein product [Brugia pahangi]|uniref:Uncharacterized protein n=1 Tax=Brugia pahangi TaxID=6280 RepID=A0A0N4TKD9_BRUPA|nr:unnamed protein product [Brugia pahangi]
MRSIQCNFTSINCTNFFSRRRPNFPTITLAPPNIIISPSYYLPPPPPLAPLAPAPAPLVVISAIAAFSVM